MNIFKMLPYDRITIEYVPPSSLGPGIFGEMDFQGLEPYKYTLKYESTPDQSLHPPTNVGLGRIAHELQHVEDSLGWSPASWREENLRETEAKGYPGTDSKRRPLRPRGPSSSITQTEQSDVREIRKVSLARAFARLRFVPPRKRAHDHRE